MEWMVSCRWPNEFSLHRRWFTKKRRENGSFRKRSAPNFLNCVLTSQNPCGSSTGSCVGVSAGFSPIGLGTETDGSIVQPSARAALYGLKPTPGNTEMEGVWMVSDVFDAVGAMAKSVTDLASITEICLRPESRANLPANGYASFFQNSFSGLKVGFLDPEVWRWPPHVQKQENGSLEQIVSPMLKESRITINHLI